MIRKILSTLILFIAFNCALAQNKYAQVVQLGDCPDCRLSQFTLDQYGNAYLVYTGDSYNFMGHHYDTGHLPLLAKLNAQGQLVWARILTIHGNSDIEHLEVQKDGNIYITGAGYDIRLDDGKVLAGGTYLIKLNNQGQTLWGVATENTQQLGIAVTGGVIAVMPDGQVFWAAGFYGVGKIGPFTINTNDPNHNASNVFVAKVSKDGQITAIYHDPALGSLHQIAVASDNEKATIVVDRGGQNTKIRLLLDKDCKLVSESPFINFGMFPRPLRSDNNGGCHMLTELYGLNSSGIYYTGFYDVHFDSFLNVITSTRLLPNEPADHAMIDAINYTDDKYFIYASSNNANLYFDWSYSDGKSKDILPKDDVDISGEDLFIRRFVKVSADTLNMIMYAHSYFANQYQLNGVTYPATRGGGMNFWVKYIYSDPDSCKKVKAQLITNGKEGSADVVIRLSLPKTCPATEDIVLDAKLETPEANKNDVIIPATVTIPKGAYEAEVKLKVIDDKYIEDTENFMLQYTIHPTAAGYVAPTATPFSIADNDNTPENKQYIIKYDREMTEGGLAQITLSLPENILLDEPLSFNFIPDNEHYQATPDVDYNHLSIRIPANTTKVTFPVNAFTDKLIEGEEYISGRLVANTTSFGTFSCTDDRLRMTIHDADNTEANRVINVQGNTANLGERNTNVYTFLLTGGNKLQVPITVEIAKQQWPVMLKMQPDDKFTFNGNGTPDALSLNYPDDHVIRTDKPVNLVLSASDEHTGTYLFNIGGVITNNLQFSAIDNDKPFAIFQVVPPVLTIKEGGRDTMRVKLPLDYVLENNTAINLKWSGDGIFTDIRIPWLTKDTILNSGQNLMKIPIRILNDDIVDPSDLRYITLKNINTDFGALPFQASDAVQVNIIDEEIGVLKIPNVFTPNGDGINDTWIITGLTPDSKAMVTVYNRNGSIVFQSKNYQPWDGTYNGKPLDVGAYYYVIADEKNKILASGSVAIIR